MYTGIGMGKEHIIADVLFGLVVLSNSRPTFLFEEDYVFIASKTKLITDIR